MEFLMTCDCQATEFWPLDIYIDNSWGSVFFGLTFGVAQLLNHTIATQWCVQVNAGTQYIHHIHLALSESSRPHSKRRNFRSPDNILKLTLATQTYHSTLEVFSLKIVVYLMSAMRTSLSVYSGAYLPTVTVVVAAQMTFWNIVVVVGGPNDDVDQGGGGGGGGTHDYHYAGCV
ncbi:hypothetical protein BV898_00411 [Hypsibius exemplaris]|uniref:Uncharacterized protein n=1 Tax=Hypsibius exemplaris TaxID=2072580 RepID=A0A1W0XDF2_HYPEX|nr:hypothetical protein BV898_00411 [Hypsibius exemplaris]